MKIKVETCFFWIILAFLASNVSALCGYYIASLFSSYFKYLLSIGIVFLSALLIGLSSGRRLRDRRNTYLQWMWLFLCIYGFLYLLNHQIVVDTSDKFLGISSYTLLAIQNAAVFSLGTYLLLSESKTLCKKILSAYLLIVIIDCVYSFYVLSINDQALRISSWVEGFDKLEEMGLHGACNALHIYSFVVLLPILTYLVFYTKQKLLPSVTMILLGLLLFVSGYTMALLLVLLYCGFLLFFRTFKNRVAGVIGFSLVVLLLLCVDWPTIFFYLAQRVSNVSMRDRLYNIYDFLQNSELGGGFAVRIKVYTKGLEGFLREPFFGNVLMGERILSNHSTVIDIMSDWGILGISTYLLFLRNMAKAITIVNANRNRWVIRHVFVMYFATILLNTLGRYANGSTVIAVILPVVLILSDNVDKPHIAVEHQHATTP